MGESVVVFLNFAIPGYRKVVVGPEEMESVVLHLQVIERGLMSRSSVDQG